MGIEQLTGEYNATLDEKGRISLPALLRRGLNETTVYLTKGGEEYLALYPSHKWNETISTIMKNTNQFSAKDRNFRRRFIGPSQEVEIDKAGRIPISQRLREFAGLSKDCVFVGQVDYIEIWAEDRYRAYIDASDEEYAAASEELSNTLKSKRGSGE